MSTHHKRSSYLATSVVSANAMKSTQSKQALYLHQALLHVLFCCSALKLTFPDQGHASCSFFRLMPLTHRSCPNTMFISIRFFFPTVSAGDYQEHKLPVLIKGPFSAPLLPAPSIMKQLLPSSMAFFQSFPFPKLWPLVHAQLLWRDSSLIVWSCRCWVRTDNIQSAQATKVVKGLPTINTVSFQELTKILSLVI